MTLGFQVHNTRSNEGTFSVGQFRPGKGARRNQIGMPHLFMPVLLSRNCIDIDICSFDLDDEQANEESSDDSSTDEDTEISSESSCDDSEDEELNSFDDFDSEIRCVDKSQSEADETTRTTNSNDVDARELKLFSCPIEGCVKIYKHYHSLQYHLDYGKCILKPERKSLLDSAKMKYHTKITSAENTVRLAHHEVSTALNALDSQKTFTLAEEGWALRETQKAKAFTEKQKAFLDEKFLIGEKTGHKLDPLTVSKQMRVVVDSANKRLFNADEFLSAKQIKGYFSRRSKSGAKGISNVDFQAAEFEEALETLRHDIIKETEAVHPLIYGGYNICELVSSKRLGKLKVKELKCICQAYDLVTKPKQRKGTFIACIEEFAKKMHLLFIGTQTIINTY